MKEVEDYLPSCSMTQEKINETKKLIAEFMGIRVIEGINNEGVKYYYYNNSEMQDFEALPDYDNSFDALISVAIKCVGLADDAMMNEWSGSIRDAGGYFTIEPLYDEIVSFIEFYNANPNEFIKE